VASAAPTPVPGALRTARLLLRPWTEADREPFARWSHDAEATRYVLRGPLEEAEIDEHHGRSLEQWRTLDFGARSILDAETERWLGFVDVSPVGPGKGCRVDDIELGYFLLPFAWGRGIATEAAVAARDDAFARTGVPELLGRFRVENAASGRVLEKAGFTFVRRHTFPDGNVAHVTRLTRREWAALVGAGEAMPQSEGYRRASALPTHQLWR